MATSSADPGDLGSFVTDATRARTELSTVATGVRAFYNEVAARCDAQYSLSNPDLWIKLDAHLRDADERDRFVGTVRDAFVAADSGEAGGAAGMVTVEDSRIASGLKAAGIGSLPTTALTVDDPVLLARAPDSGFADDPVCTANGNFVEQELDLPLPGRAEPASWQRTYNSRAHHRVGAHGRGWSSWADTALDLGSELIEWRAPDGAESIIERPGPDRPTAIPRLGAQLHADGSGFRFERGPAETWWYDEAGRPVRVRVERSEITLDWSGGRLVGVDHPRSGRSVLLEWNDAGTLITAVRASDGRTVSYTYDDDAQLVAVDGGPQGARRYEYTAGLLTAVVDADGVTLARNSYDETGRVLTQLTPEGRLVRFGYPGGYRTLVTDADAGAINEYRHDAAGRLTCVVDDADRAFHRVFDDAGRLRGVRERSGARWSMDYDDAGRLTRRAGPCDITEQWTWDDSGRLTSHTDPRGAQTRWIYAGTAHTPAEIVDATGALTRITVSDDDLPTCVVDPDGVTTRFRWDGDGQLTDLAVAGGGRTRLRYDPAGRLVEVIGPDGYPRRWETDDTGRVILEDAPGGLRSRFHYTAAGRPDGYVDPAGGRWTSTYGPHGRVEQATDPLGSTVGFEYDPFGNTRLIVAPDGQKFHFDHDGLGRLTTVSDPAGATFHRGYDPDGQPTVETDGDGHAWQVHYDDAGRPVEPAAPDGRVWRREYNPAGSVLALTDPAGATTRYEYDPRGRIVAVIDAAGGRRTIGWTPGGRLATVTSPLGRQVTYRYDKAGRLAETLSPSGARTVYRRDPAGRLTGLVTPAGRETRWEYDPQGTVSAVIRPGGRRLTIERNPLGLPVTVTEADGATRRYTYDARGALTSATDPLGAVTHYEHDTRGRVSAWTDPLGGRHLLRYDEVGRQTGATDPLGRTTTITRDANGTVDTIRRADGSGLRWWRNTTGQLTGRGVPGEDQPRLRYSYDPAGRLVTAEPATPPDPATADAAPDTAVTLAYDTVGQLISHTTAAGRLEFGYDPDGRRVSTGQAGATPLRYDYDADGYLRSIEHPALGQRRLTYDPDGRPDTPGRTIKRDAAGRIVRIVEHGTELRFGYDAAGQLVTADGPWGRQTLTWDLGGRLIAEDHGDPATTVRSTFDAAGQLLTRQIGDEAATTFRYDTAGRRVAADGPAGTVEYSWDALGHLAEIRRLSTGSDGPADPTTQLTVDALGDPLQVNGIDVLWDPVGWPGQVHSVGTTTYAHTGTALGIIEDSAPSDETGPGRWIETDWQGSPGSYDPWGQPISSGPTGQTGEPAGAVGLGYRGELTVDGLVWQRERLLDPATRSFLSPDPLDHVPGLPGTANPYHYAYNDPIGMLDPTGLRPLSDKDYNNYRAQDHRNTLGKAWHNIQHDPWGSLAAAAVIGLGVGLMFVPGGQVIGAGILIGSGISTGLGLLTGNLNPRMVAVSGIAGGIGGGVGQATTGMMSTTSSYLAAATSGMTSGAAGDLAQQELTHPGHLNIGELAVSTATGGLAGAATSHLIRPGDFMAGDNYTAAGHEVTYTATTTAVGQDAQTMRNMTNVQPINGIHDVIAHGTQDGFVSLDGEMTNAGQLVDAVRANPNYIEGTPCRLLVCHSGVSGAGQQFADELQVPVLAPNDMVGTYRFLPPGQEPVVHNGRGWTLINPAQGVR